MDDEIKAAQRTINHQTVSEELCLCCKRRASQEGLKHEFNVTMFLCHIYTLFPLI